jgi:hypothetical protein
MRPVDDFVIVLPKAGHATFVEPGDDLWPHANQTASNRGRTIQLHSGESVTGRVIRLRDATREDELRIIQLVNSRFKRPVAGEAMTLPAEDGPGTVPEYSILRVLGERVGGVWPVEASDGRRCYVRNDVDFEGNHLVWIGELANS